MSWIMPFPEKAITGEYGTMSDYRRKKGMQAHSGTDWAPAGSRNGKTLIPAIANGTIKLTQFSKILGWVVVQTAADKDGKIWYIGYCHLKCNKCGINCKGGHDASQAFKIKVGDKVKAGDTSHGLTCGTSGLASSGVHLHATLGKTVKAVFGMTRDKYDLKKAIKDNSGPSEESNVNVELEPKNGNIVVKITGIPKGSKMRLRKDGKSVWNKTIVDPKKVQTKGVTLTGKHTISVEMNDYEVFTKEVEPQKAAAPAAPAPQKVVATGGSENVVAPVAQPATPAPVAPAPATSTNELDKTEWAAFQGILKRDYSYSGPIDGDPGKNTYIAIQRSVQSYGYTGPLDGLPGTNTWKAVQRRLVARGTYEGRVDGVWGGQTFAALRNAIRSNKY